MKGNDRYSRRSVLRGLGATTALLPLLNAERAFAAGTEPRRLLLVILSNGMLRDQFWPTGGDGRNLATMQFKTITKSLEPYRSDLTFVRNLYAKNYRETRNLRFTCGHYSYAPLFTGTIPVAQADRLRVTPTSASIDQVIAEDLATRVKLPIKSMHLGMLKAGGDVDFTAFYKGPGAPIIPEINPSRALSTFFQGMNSGSMSIARLRAERKSILDFVGRDLTRFSERLGTDDRSNVERHIQSVRELEKQTDELSSATCTPPTVPAGDPAARANYPQMLSAQMNLIITAFKCDLTRVATLQLSSFNGNEIYFPWLGVNRQYHSLAHDSRTELKLPIDVWFTQQFAELLKRLKNTPDGTSTLLDNTLVVFINHMGDGRKHDYNDLPCILAGRCGGAIKTGLNLDPGPSTPTNRLHVSLAKAMGLSMNTFGDPKFGSGSIPGLLT